MSPLPLPDLFVGLDLAIAARHHDLQVASSLPILERLSAQNVGIPQVFDILVRAADIEDKNIYNMSLYHLLRLRIPLTSPLITGTSHFDSLLFANYNLANLLRDFVKHPPKFYHNCGNTEACSRAWREGWKAGTLSIYSVEDPIQSFGSDIVVSGVVRKALRAGMSRVCLVAAMEFYYTRGKDFVQCVVEGLNSTVIEPLGS